ncbi:hypothetical protein BN14_10984 [Rhizoctonia solani AG-1 IB]|uniref:Uncharacterized protein n=1 Tax=Thanatephorus cucumeris (strain AG1-IB / isolate 7/3/14) TaxID=1108050 RepID=M5C9Y4_THACB|nr:hypothetical protein BN14_10984 [Rhizoctonia solani AG-1 IB]
MAEADANEAIAPMEIDREDVNMQEHTIHHNNDQDPDDRSDYGPSKDSDGGGDHWEVIVTPAPSLPPTPPQSPSPDDSEPEDDLARVTANDYREYDHWFGEDQHELDKIVLEMLTEEEMDSIKMTAIRLFGHISERNYELCKEPRFDSKGRPQQCFEYLPMNPRLLGFFKNPEMIEKMYYRARYTQEEGAMDDYIDAKRYKKLAKSNIVIDGKDLGVQYFSGSRDMAYAVMTDGVKIFEQAHQEASTCWPIMAVNLNLPASDRCKLQNLIPLGVIPGPNQPKDFDLFLEPFVEEALEQACGIKAYDVTRRQKFTLRTHPIIISGDMQAIKHVSQMKGPNGKAPCRECETVGVYHHGCRSYYIPLANPTDNPNAIPDERLDPNAPPNTITTLDPENLPLRTTQRIAEQLEMMDNACTQREFNNLARDFGLTGHSILDRIPSICRPDSYPHEFLHLFLLNHGPQLVSLWAGTYVLGEDDEYTLRLFQQPLAGLFQILQPAGDSTAANLGVSG